MEEEKSGSSAASQGHTRVARPYRLFAFFAFFARNNSCSFAQFAEGSDLHPVYTYYRLLSANHA